MVDESCGIGLIPQLIEEGYQNKYHDEMLEETVCGEKSLSLHAPSQLLRVLLKVQIRVRGNCWKGNANEAGTWPSQGHYKTQMSFCRLRQDFPAVVCPP